MRAGHMIITTAGLDHQHTHHLKPHKRNSGKRPKKSNMGKKHAVTVMPLEI